MRPRTKPNGFEYVLWYGSTGLLVTTVGHRLPVALQVRTSQNPLNIHWWRTCQGSDVSKRQHSHNCSLSTTVAVYSIKRKRNVSSRNSLTQWWYARSHHLAISTSVCAEGPGIFVGRCGASGCIPRTSRCSDDVKISCVRHIAHEAGIEQPAARQQEMTALKNSGYT